MDTYVLNAIVHELRPRLCPSTVNGLWQADDHSLMIGLWHHGQEERLAISIAPQHQYLYLSSTPAPRQVLTFGKFLHHHIKGGELHAISKPLLERVVTFELAKRDIDGQPLRFLLILELMGRHSNLILVQQETHKILESLRHVTAAQSSYRRIAPGAEYVPPPRQDKLDPLSINQAAFQQLIETHQHQSSLEGRKAAPFWKFFLEHVEGFSPLLAKEIAGDDASKTDVQARWQRFTMIIETATTGRYQPQIIIDPTHQGLPKTIGISAIALRQTTCTPCDSMNQAAEQYYQTQVERQQMTTLRNGLFSALQAHLAKLHKKRAHLIEQQTQSDEADQYKRYGELLTANLSQIKKGVERVEVKDYYTEEQALLCIPLDPRLSPNQNAQRYFKRYSKLKQGRAITSQRLQETEDAIAHLEEWQFFVEDAETVQRLQTLYTEFQDMFAPSRKLSPKQPQSGNAVAAPFLRYISSDGFEIYVGCSSKENDLLTQRTALPEDIWLHVHQTPGSHVLILNRQRNTPVPDRTIQEAAALAAYYSKSRRAGRVDVIYTSRKYVKKPKGSPPGLVRVVQFQTVRVAPRKELKVADCT